MITRSYTINKAMSLNGQVINPVDEDYISQSNRSLRLPSGKLYLKPQTYLLKHDKRVSYVVSKPTDAGPNDAWAPQAAGRDRAEYLTRDTSIEDTVALAKYNGRLRYGGASLGISIAQWRQSDDMIRSRLKKFNHLLVGVETQLKRNLRTKSGRRRFKRDKALGRNPRYSRRTRDPLASQVLEYSFGWQPLVKDLVAATTTLFTHAIPGEYVRARHRLFHNNETIGTDSSTLQQRFYVRGYTSTTVSANVAIENPNLWLANRAGLIDLPGIAWDAIPWSFLVGMFVNVNQLLGQFTNEVGLSVTDRSTTRHRYLRTFIQTDYRYTRFVPFTRTIDQLLRNEKTRVVGSFPAVSLMWKVPDISIETLVIAASLAVQRMGRISKLLDASYLLSKRL